MKWEFTPAELLYAWGQIRWDRIPAPLAVHPTVASQDEWEAIDQELRGRLPVLQDPDLLPVLRTAADPDTSLTLVGARKNPLRIYGAVTEDIGVTMVQRAGPTPDSGGNIIVQVGSPALLPKVVAAVVGEAPAGRHRAMVETWERVQDEWPETWMVTDQPPLADRMRSLLAAPRSGHGHIEVRLDRHADRPHPPRYMSWFDVHRDGRYTYTRQYADFRIDPCTPDRFHRILTRMLTP
ncbi:ESX secretion-associated protein EspG [Nocardia macrotermitis]|uniref:ESX secretion-associated protein EspG n=1 Tax=Nocardia macrotermitis TaxID=2585198 RepID=A0A7K0DAV0_9NOCA|nr:ESX secretion-associated protein EspG [Nocardia macrotermitis]MQY22913.1 hypothetical protein [Nocardia macrotermitis]